MSVHLSVFVHPKVLENVAWRITLKSVEGWALYEVSFMGTIVKGCSMSRNQWPRNMKKTSVHGEVKESRSYLTYP